MKKSNLILGLDVDQDTVTIKVDKTAHPVFLDDFRYQYEGVNLEDVPEEIAFYGDNMYFFLNGKIYLHGGGPVNKFFDSERKSATMEFITNQYPETQKSFETLSLDANGSWTAVMEVEADNNHPDGQETEIFEKMFKNREGSLNSAVPRNLIKRNGDKDPQLLYSGNKMLGHAMKVSITSVNFDKLREVKVTSINQK